jgi:NTP pyrophosphatase (non-canonical NTP hydrolase)
MNNFAIENIELISIIKNSLSAIQEKFDIYQKNCFTQKPAEFFCLELNGEAGELANIEKKQWKGKKVEFSKYEDEAADVFIALMNYCNARGVNLEKAVVDKLTKIEIKRQNLNNNNLEYL